MKYLFYISFFLLCLLSIGDPGNSILGMKEVAFAITLFFGFFYCRGLSGVPTYVLTAVFMIGFLLPLLGMIIGLGIGNQFKMEVCFGYIKSMLFIFLLLVMYKGNYILHKEFAIATLILLPLILGIRYFIINSGIDAIPLLFDEDAVKVSRRAYGPILIDPVVFYKTSPLLIFGLSFICSVKTKVKYIIIPIILVTLFFTGTRANMISGLLVSLIWLWTAIKKNRILRTTFISVGVIIGLMYVPYLINDVFFSQDEASMEIKASHMSSYVDYWTNNPINFLFGQGIGSGMYTKAEGLVYLIEPTYMELIRHWGILFFPLTFYFLVFGPAYFYFKNRNIDALEPYHFFVYAYYAYAFVEIPSNPLLFGSSGMIVLSLAYVVVCQIKKQKNHVLHSPVNV